MLAVRTHVDEVSTDAALIAPRGLVGSHVKLFPTRQEQGSCSVMRLTLACSGSAWS